MVLSGIVKARGGLFQCFFKAMRLLVLFGFYGLRQNWRLQIEEVELDNDNRAIAGVDFEFKTLVSILLPVDEVEPQFLQECLVSLGNQIYPHWELCISLGESVLSENRQLLSRFADQDRRLKMISRSNENGASVNAALSMAEGEYICLLHPADKLPVNSLCEIAKELNRNKNLDMIYGDENQIDCSGRLGHPWLKPGWSPEMLESCWYTGNFTCYRAELLRELGGFREEFGDSSSYDLVLRFTEKYLSIKHIQKILYHWRRLPGSNGIPYTPRDNTYNEALRALSERGVRLTGEGEAHFTPAIGCYELIYSIKGCPLVSIIVPTTGKSTDYGPRRVNMVENLIKQIREMTTWKNIEILIIDHNKQVPPETRNSLQNLQCRLLDYDGEFNFSRMNNLAAREADGKYLLFMNDDLEIISKNWLEKLLHHAQKSEVGVVGCKLWNTYGKVQHIGVVFNETAIKYGFGFLPGHIGYDFDVDSIDPLLLYANQNYLAVTGAAMMTPTSHFKALNGFNEELKIVYNDIDYCLKNVKSGYRVVLAANVEFYHHDSRSRDNTSFNEDEVKIFSETWGEYICNECQVSARPSKS